MTAPTAHIDQRRMELDRSRERLIAAEDKALAAKRQHFVSLTASLDAMSPLRVLTRGYTIASNPAGDCVRSVEDVRTGDHLSLTVTDGKIGCVVEDVKRS